MCCKNNTLVAVMSKAVENDSASKPSCYNV